MKSLAGCSSACCSFPREPFSLHVAAGGLWLSSPNAEQSRSTVWIANTLFWAQQPLQSLYSSDCVQIESVREPHVEKKKKKAEGLISVTKTKRCTNSAWGGGYLRNRGLTELFSLRKTALVMKGESRSLAAPASPLGWGDYSGLAYLLTAMQCNVNSLPC